MSSEAVKLTVAAAALTYGLPERSLFRAVEKGRIPSTKKDGVAVLDRADVEAKAARRAAAQAAGAPAAATPSAMTAAAMAGSLPAAHGTVAVGSGRSPLRVALDGDLTAALIARYKRGEGPVDAAEGLRIPLTLAIEGHDLFLRAKHSKRTPMRPSLPQPSHLNRRRSGVGVLAMRASNHLVRAGRRRVGLLPEEGAVNDRAEDLIADLALALDDEEEARGSARAARSRQAELVRALRATGIRFGVIAHRVARARGAMLTIDDRLRLAECLRKRAARGATRLTSEVCGSPHCGSTSVTLNMYSTRTGFPFCVAGL